ncbi:MAG: hypothetical protein QW140_01780 [Candidatus Aenigmatarchaeota archaeon]
MEMKKAQVDIISAIIIVIIALTLFSAAYFWGMPLIQKRQDTALVERAFKYFDPKNPNSIGRRIEYVANFGGEQTFSIDLDGIWILKQFNDVSEENNSLLFTFSSKISNVAPNFGWVPFSSNIQEIGKLGLDDPSVVFERADSSGGRYDITLRVWFRELESMDGTKGYKINLINDTAGRTVSTSKYIKISRGNIISTQENGKTLTITEIKILLV